MIQKILKDWISLVNIGLFVLFSLWFASQNFGTSTDQQDQFLAAVYGITALWGGIWGIVAALKWGGLKSILGKSVFFFSLGLLFQEFGQLSYSYYIYRHIEVPYPSTGDIGFFGSIPLYIYGVFLLGRASGMSIGIKSFENKIQAIIIPVLMLLGGYWLFLVDYTFDWTTPLVIFLDFGYPLAQAIYISLAILIYLLSRNVLGGIMRPHIMFIVAALVIQFISDYTFLYQAHQGTWSAGGINDFMYMLSYTVMGLALSSFRIAALKIKNE